MEINQFHSGTAVGDAITNQMLELQSLLKDRGYKSEIYAEYIAEGLEDRIKPISQYEGAAENILFVHHSMQTNSFEKIISLPDKKALIYHNITPAHFFEDEGLKKAVCTGLKQTEEYRKYVDYAIADSNFNRKELLGMGYTDVDVMPVQISLNRFDKTESDQKVKADSSKYKNFIFVGRVVPNKKPDDVIRVFSVYHKYYNKNSRLFLIGDDSMNDYVQSLKKLCLDIQVSDCVFFTGRVSEKELKAYYEIADLFLCMSEHEGFGVPLLESMKMNVPIVSYSSSAIPETMGGAGVLVTEKNYAYTGALCNEILEDKELYEKIVQKENIRIDKLEKTNTDKILFSIIERIQSGERKRTIQLQGPFETSYSLAIVNRKLIETIDDISQDYDASIYCTEGPGDYEPKEEDLKGKEHARLLWEKSKTVSYPDVVIRNMYPPRVMDTNGGLNFQAFGWEESVIPHNYIADFNKYLSGIGTMSEYVTQILKDNGLEIPVKTMGIGVQLVPNFAELSPYHLNTKKKNKFLHISSAFPRKGVDVLLKGYFDAFTAKDDVCLVLKTFPNPHNNVESILAELRGKHPNPPEVEWINCDLSDEQLNSLYKACDCYVQTARGEGFGLPVAEAMLAKVPVIVCANSGMADFCNEDTAVLVDFVQAPAHTHVTTEGALSMWFEPVQSDLTAKLRSFVFEKENLHLEDKIENAYQLIKNDFSWEAVAKRWLDFIEEVREIQSRPKVSMVTTWNSKCGIAEYTKMEIDATKYHIDYRIYPNYTVAVLKADESNVAKRLWGNVVEGDMKDLTKELLQDSSEFVHFQFNYGFFELHNFAESITELSKCKKVIVTFHKTDDGNVNDEIVSLKTIVDELNLCTAIIVHQQRDKDLLTSYGVRPEIIHVVVHGQVVYPEIDPQVLREQKGIKARPVIGSYGFLLPHKGVKEVIQAVSLLKEKYPDILYMPVCALYEDKISVDYYHECVDEVKRLNLENNVKFMTDFLPNDKSMSYLQMCDALVMAYKPTGESASGAIRFCLATRRPIVVTKQPIFEEFKDYTYQIDEASMTDIAKAITDILEDKKYYQEYHDKMNQYIEEHSWTATGEQLYKLYTGLE